MTTWGPGKARGGRPVKIDIKAHTIGTVRATESNERGESTGGQLSGQETPRAHGRILFVSATPVGTPSLRLDQELRLVSDAVNRSGSLSLEVLYRTSLHDLRLALLASSFAFVHFSCHGEQEGLVLEGEGGRSSLLEASDLLGFLRAHIDRAQLRALVLNACWSSTVAAAIAPYFGHVVGMTGRVESDAASEFSRGFYDAIAARRSVKQACEEGGRCVRALHPNGGFELTLFEDGRRRWFRV
jgi:hypothetical protein